MRINPNILAGLVVLLLAAGIVYANQEKLTALFLRPTPSDVETGIGSGSEEDITVVAQDLTVPWDIAFLPDGELLVTERAGSIVRIGKDRQKYSVEGVSHIGEGGLLGIALHPQFVSNRWLYIYYTTENDGVLTNRVERYVFANDKLTEKTDIITNLPASRNHDGGRMIFGPQGFLFIAVGDAEDPESAQNTSLLSGKILRLTDRGAVPRDNPFGNAVYSYGHRNPQGLVWDSRGQLWSTEHGPSGVGSGYDEVNLIKKGANYGWPVIQGDQSREGMEKPVLQSGGSDTWAPASLTYRNGSLFFGGLRAETLYEAKIAVDNTLTLKAHLRGQYGRLRTAVFNKEGMLYLTTSNTDGRGTKKPNDDKVLRISPALFE